MTIFLTDDQKTFLNQSIADCNDSTDVYTALIYNKLFDQYGDDDLFAIISSTMNAEKNNNITAFRVKCDVFTADLSRSAFLCLLILECPVTLENTVRARFYLIR
jgi:hypothetical protein